MDVFDVLGDHPALAVGGAAVLAALVVLLLFGNLLANSSFVTPVIIALSIVALGLAGIASWRHRGA